MVVARPEYQAWSELLRYPGRSVVPEIKGRINELIELAPTLADDLAPLRDSADEHGDAHLEELFTRTFDSNAERALEVGWHIHGENYARGVLMVRVRRMLRDHEIAESDELPDHVSHLLLLLAQADDVLTSAIARQMLGPALARILLGFEDPGNPYEGVVRGLRSYLESKFPGPEWSVAPPEPMSASELLMEGCSNV